MVGRAAQTERRALVILGGTQRELPTNAPQCWYRARGNPKTGLRINSITSLQTRSANQCSLNGQACMQTYGAVPVRTLYACACTQTHMRTHICVHVCLCACLQACDGTRVLCACLHACMHGFVARDVRGKIRPPSRACSQGPSQTNQPLGSPQYRTVPIAAELSRPQHCSPRQLHTCNHTQLSAHLRSNWRVMHTCASVDKHASIECTLSGAPAYPPASVRPVVHGGTRNDIVEPSMLQLNGCTYSRTTRYVTFARFTSAAASTSCSCRGPGVMNSSVTCVVTKAVMACTVMTYIVMAWRDELSRHLCVDNVSMSEFTINWACTRAVHLSALCQHSLEPTLLLSRLPPTNTTLCQHSPVPTLACVETTSYHPYLVRTLHWTVVSCSMLQACVCVANTAAASICSITAPLVIPPNNCDVKT